MKLCTVDDCDARLVAKGLCSAHYQRVRLHGDPLTGGPVRPTAKRYQGDVLEQCSVADCGQEVRVLDRGLCGLHYQRWRKYGDAAAPYTRYKRQRWINHHGYVRIKTGVNKSEFEHRVVMAEMLGRPLAADENVHHLNGDRADNRPENLELWTRSQPPGQRVTDKVEWAYALLRRYAPERLNAMPAE